VKLFPIKITIEKLVWPRRKAEESNLISNNMPFVFQSNLIAMEVGGEGMRKGWGSGREGVRKV